MTVEEMLERMSSVELTEWYEKYKRDPFGDPWLQVATICKTIANGLMKRRDGREWMISDFWPVQFIKPVRRQSEKEIEAVFEQALQQVAAKPKKPKKKK